MEDITRLPKRTQKTERDEIALGFYWIKTDNECPWEIAYYGPVGWFVWHGFSVTPCRIGARIPFPE